MKVRLSVSVVDEREIEVSPEGLAGLLLSGRLEAALAKLAELQKELDEVCPGAKAEICLGDGHVSA